MIKLFRNYSFTAATQDVNPAAIVGPPTQAELSNLGNPISVSLPFTIEFDITRNVLSSANFAVFRIMNLAPHTRNKLRFNFYNTGEYRPISFSAGYGQLKFPVAFSGNITQADSVREGSTFVTTIEANDGGFAFANALTNTQFPAGTTQQVIMESLAKSLGQYQIATGSIGAYPGTISRGNSYSGSTTEILTELSNGGFFIDNQKVNCLGNAECVLGGIPLINAASGLLGTPVLQQTILSFDMLFEPGLVAGQQISLQSVTSQYSGLYKVVAIHHRGVISQAVCGDAVTSLQMFYGPSSLSVIGAAL